MLFDLCPQLWFTSPSKYINIKKRSSNRLLTIWVSRKTEHISVSEMFVFLKCSNEKIIWSLWHSNHIFPESTLSCSLPASLSCILLIKNTNKNSIPHAQLYITLTRRFWWQFLGSVFFSSFIIFLLVPSSSFECGDLKVNVFHRE